MRISSTSDFLHVAAMIEKVLQILFWSSTHVSRRTRIYLGTTLLAYLHVFVLTNEQQVDTLYIWLISILGNIFYLDKSGI